MKKTIQLAFLHLFLANLGIQAQQELPKDENFRVETLVSGLVDAMELAVTKDGKVFIIERTGKVKLFDSSSNKTIDIAKFEVALRSNANEGSPEKNKKFDSETGLLGIALDPNFEENGWLYLYYSPRGKSLSQLSRFTFGDNKLADEKIMIKIPRDRGDNICHEGGALEFGPDGLLYLATGDNTNPFESSGSAPIDERKGHEYADAQRTAANTNNLRGKILRIKPAADGGYTIPDGNLFKKGMEKTRPEIYIMGCRNPYRFSIDKKTNFLYWAQVGPDAGRKSNRGPSGYDEINQAKKAGNFGWPYFAGNNEAYTDYDFSNKKLGKVFDPKKPINTSVNNTGLTELPPAQPAFQTMRHSCNCVGPVYYTADFSKTATRFPDSMDSTVFTYDWNNGRISLIKIDDKGKKLWTKRILMKHKFIRPTDMEFGVNGELYVLEYGSAWRNNKDSKLKRITYTEKKIAINTKKFDPRIAGLPVSAPGTKMISESNCLACHMSNKKSVGPTYFDVAKKYKDKNDAAEYLAKKILTGSKGVWGEQPMPAHPQLNIEQTQQMAEAILKTKSIKQPK